jgi:cyclic pyranopterin phosphate synthase
MEAIMGVNAALITIYDLSKIVNPHLKIDDVKLLIKEGGKVVYGKILMDYLIF